MLKSILMAGLVTSSLTISSGSYATAEKCFDWDQIIEVNLEFIDFINSIRRKGTHCGSTWYPAVQRVSYDHSGALMGAAVGHSAQMADRNFFSHWNPYMQTCTGTRADHFGYQGHCVGENITAGTYKDTIYEAFVSLKNSPGHCANMMNPSYQHVGIGCAQKEDSNYGFYWTMVLGFPGQCKEKTSEFDCVKK